MEVDRVPSDRVAIGSAFAAAALGFGAASYFMPSIVRKFANRKRKSARKAKSVPVTKQVLINVLEDSLKNIKESAAELEKQINAYKRVLAAQRQKATFPISFVSSSEQRFYKTLESVEEKLFAKHSVSKEAIEEASEKYKTDSDVKTLLKACNDAVPKFHFSADEAFNLFKTIQDAQITKMKEVAAEEEKKNPRGTPEYVNSGGRRMRGEAEELKKEMMKDMNVCEPFMEAYIEHYFFTNPRFAKKLKRALRDHVKAIEECGLESGTTLNQSTVEGLDDEDSDDELSLDAPQKTMLDKLKKNKVAAGVLCAAALVGGSLLVWHLRKERDPFADFDFDFQII